ncbi:hypothetical protein [Geofilum rubicundum]|uniref:Tyrosine-protein kinase Wzc n=1 Tax=Geofilum rubicundum JCM 15548 TaxID=1236989 RepID=A0A0E9LZU8_9BACT|nr:hypothetical protein [Geofilum rubicundum]GAO31092.1 hypothetical protein JCM15548_13428 [Geofilum rubicundum JCM 15548]
MAIPVNQPGQMPGKNISNDGFSDIRKIIRLIIRNWYLFVIFVPIGLGTAWIYHRYTVPVYRASITMIFKVDQERSFSNSVLTEALDSRLKCGASKTRVSLFAVTPWY